MPTALIPVERRDLARIEALARSVLVQCGHLRRNMAKDDDRIRFLLIHGETLSLEAVAARCERRYEQQKQAADA